MKEWNEIYRDLLAGQNMIAEAIASAKMLHERDTRRMNELKSDGDEWRRRAQAYEKQIATEGWRPIETVPDSDEVELLVRGYIGDDGHWYYRDGTDPLIAWRPITE